jgi:hypothetical protein
MAEGLGRSSIARARMGFADSWALALFQERRKRIKLLTIEAAKSFGRVFLMASLPGPSIPDLWRFHTEFI